MKMISLKLTRPPFHLIFVLISSLLVTLAANAATLKMADGSTVEGEIQFTTKGSVFVKTGPDSVKRLKKKELDPSEVGTIETWESTNSINARLSTKFDAQPQPVKMKSPERDGDIANLTGMVMLAVVIDESGSVEEAFVRQSSDERFNGPSITAIKGWAFSPLTRDAKPTRGLMFVPMQY